MLLQCRDDFDFRPIWFPTSKAEIRTWWCMLSDRIGKAVKNGCFSEIFCSKLLLLRSSKETQGKNSWRREETYPILLLAFLPSFLKLHLQTNCKNGVISEPFVLFSSSSKEMQGILWAVGLKAVSALLWMTTGPWMPCIPLQEEGEKPKMAFFLQLICKQSFAVLVGSWCLIPRLDKENSFISTFPVCLPTPPLL